MMKPITAAIALITAATIPTIGPMPSPRSPDVLPSPVWFEFGSAAGWSASGAPVLTTTSPGLEEPVAVPTIPRMC